MQISEFRRRAVFDQLKHPDKGRKTGESGLQCHLCDGEAGVYQKLFRMFDPLFVQIFIEGKAGEIFEEPAEMVFAETGQIRDAVQGQIFGAVFLDIIADGHELFHMFFLLVGGLVESVPLSGIFPDYQNQHFYQLGINGSTDQDGITEIFLADFQHQVF